MIRKIGVLGISLLCFAAIISCEKDFSDIGSNVVSNTKFETGEILLDVEITPVDIQSVRADNIAIGRLGEYWLGIYKNDNYKTVQSSFVSQLTALINPKTADVKAAVNDGEIDSIYTLDKVVLKLPYTATNIGKETDGKPKFRLDSLLGDPDLPTPVQVYRNGTYLNTLDPNNPANQNRFESNHSYIESELLSENSNFSFKPSPKDTMLILTRNISNGNTYKDTIKLDNKAPFLTIPLNTTRMKELFWDKFKDSEFSTTEAFADYFRGLIIKSEGTNGSMVPLNILGTTASATLDFHFTITTFEKKDGQANLVLKDTLPNTYSFALSGVRNSIYKTSPVVTPAPANNFIIQGMAGTAASVKILDQTKLQDLRSNNWLINDASLTFYINQTVNTDKNILPQRLFVYQNIDNGSGGFTPTQISDAHREVAFFGGNLELTDDKPDKYTFKITDYISDLLDNTTNDINPLTLKVYNNPTDNAFGSNNALDTNVKTYNWNPRGVTLLDGNETANTTRRAVLKISYSKEK
ncbi:MULTISPECIES: DUF4270 family protein [unclassified Tenacibaculum]|uniref:DUF4270 family protein n=1 Tax=unclassified Tenacibaculum TaxID=2635139 RepID=UPI001F3B82CB|nr:MULTISPECIES: DUF4270 family protein [unclassified Tenacibaculum]MCF2876035.1 DUF4270 domain-containing protein [Tenacibaculum sp. Cn5-1]MCF2936110.1 DUF4270 domain-containing protein [Tenacibaculum sp. Cn5-34]MCG7512671.1 DUF4270 domain-containing protein [Tenacibaculum sp. Cn5-46]